jgi:hypothetical protein
MTRGEAALKINVLYGRGFGALRRLAGFGNLRALGKATDFAPATLSEIERGTRPLKAHEIEWFCSFFADRIPGYSEDDCLEILRKGARSHLRAVRDDEDGDGSGWAPGESNPEPTDSRSVVLQTLSAA